MACGVASVAAKVEAVNERAEIRLEDGRLVRLAGLDIPARGGFDAAALARARLTEGWIGKNVNVAVLAARPDRWGRWLADLTLPDGPAASTELLNAGLARVHPEFETRGCEEERFAAEAAARAASSGLWNDPDSILDAGDLDLLRVNDGRFVLIEGVVRRVGVGRSRVYLDFGRRGGFSVVVARKGESAFQRRGIALNALAGQAIRVRGVLEDRFGLRIELADPFMIERLDRPGGEKEAKPGG
jgi:endonuclease YncB( thermonuclease family)